MTGEYKNCKKCRQIMHGIRNYKARKVCESCGGNQRKYNYDNPIPDGSTDKERKNGNSQSK